MPKEIIKPPAHTTQERKAEVSDEKTLMELGKAYRAFEYTRNPDPYKEVEENFSRARSILRGIVINEATLLQFIDKRLTAHTYDTDFQTKAGVFLSAMIQNSQDTRLTLDLRNIPPLDYLCCFLSEPKDVTIVGDVGNGAAIGARSGMITVNGNAESHFGAFLRGANAILNGQAEDDAAFGAESGSVTIKKGARNYAGAFLKGASLVIELGAEDNVGEKAESGEIRVGGKIKSLGKNMSTRVTVSEAGHQVWPKRRWAIFLLA